MMITCDKMHHLLGSWRNNYSMLMNKTTGIYHYPSSDPLRENPQCGQETASMLKRRNQSKT